MSNMKNPKLLNAWMTGFYGYGTWAAPTWFVGMEEGGGGLEERLQAWRQRGTHDLEHLPVFCKTIDETKWHGDRPRIQRTWGRLIRFLMAARGEIPQNAQIRDYQARKWGTWNGETCVVELLPLPSRSIGSWEYARYSGAIPFLRSRKDYVAQLATPRSQFLNEKIRKCKPELVVFYGLSPKYLCHWQHIAGGGFELEKGIWVLGGKRGKSTLFCALKHPASRGSTNEDFQNAGRFIGALLKRHGA